MHTCRLKAGVSHKICKFLMFVKIVTFCPIIYIADFIYFAYVDLKQDFLHIRNCVKK